MPGSVPRRDTGTLVGVDEAGRGAWVGPLVVGAVAIRADELARLEAAGAEDSKALRPTEREEVYARMEPFARFASIELAPAEIDRFVRQGRLNELEARAFGEVVRPFAPALVRVDACDTNPRRFGSAVARFAGPGFRVVSRHHADADDPLVGAASIVATVRRDRAVRRLADELGADLGSGYPSDPVTVAYVRQSTAGARRLPEWLRSSWATTQRVIGARPARTLEESTP